MAYGDKIYGYAVYQNFDELNMTQVIYLAILPQHRRAGYGGPLLQGIKTLTGRPIILEVENPETAKTQGKPPLEHSGLRFTSATALLFMKI
ncbi:MAG: GNAT family N-acetyltransferase [Oscillospiraceae bacterium]